jgi:hypothetical protein
LLIIAKELSAAASIYGWNNPDEPVQIFCDFLLELADALRKGEAKAIKKVLGKISNYGKAILLTKKLYRELMSILAAIDEELKMKELDTNSLAKLAKDVEVLVKDIIKEYF